MKSETAGLPASAQSINHMLSFQGRLKSASHSDVRIKPLKINVSCPPLPLCLLSLCVSLSLSLSLTVTQSSGKNIDFVSLFFFLLTFFYFWICVPLWSSLNSCRRSNRLCSGPRHGVIYSTAGVCSSDAPQTRRQQSSVGVLSSSGGAEENSLPL